LRNIARSWRFAHCSWYAVTSKLVFDLADAVGMP
jgi:hypothetical protein